METHIDIDTVYKIIGRLYLQLEQVNIQAAETIAKQQDILSSRDKQIGELQQALINAQGTSSS